MFLFVFNLVPIYNTVEKHSLTLVSVTKTNVCMCETETERQRETIYVVGNITLKDYLQWIFCFCVPLCGHGTYRCKCLYENVSHSSLFCLLHFCGDGFMHICLSSVGGQV